MTCMRWSWLIATLLLAPFLAHASTNGKTGRSKSGCGACHGGTADGTTSVAFATDSTTVYPGDTVTVTLIVSTTDASHTYAGLDVSASSGALAAGSNDKLSSSEITHSAPVKMSSSAVVFDFSWTAPVVEGTYTLYAAGNAVNNNGGSDGDGWNLASNLTLLVDDGCNDLDADGVTDCAGDCDDTNASIYPGAPEHCDGVDEDCDGVVDNSAVDATIWYADVDGDGYGDGAVSEAACSAAADEVVGSGDCDDSDNTIYPGAADAWYDGVDSNCDGADDYDADGDGVDADDHAQADGTFGTDCDDSDATISPLATEMWYDGVDENCDGADDYDADGDGFDAASYGGTDCDDANPSVYVGAPDDPTDGLVDDCALRTANDQDGDGYDAISAGGTDCNDSNSNVHPGAVDVPYDGLDANCDGLSDFDADGDGYDSVAFLGTDCDDADPRAHPTAAEIWYDGVDENCDGADDYDQDGDGYDSASNARADGSVGPDCDDTDPAISPVARDIPYDGIDQDCSGGDLADVDGDGEDAIVAGGPDCDDTNAAINTHATEIPYDGIDQDCSGADLTDVDGDGVDAIAAGGTDCNDTDPTITSCDTGGDSGVRDSGEQDSGVPDSGPADSGPADSGDTATVQPPPLEGVACGCADGGVAPFLSASFVAVGLLLGRRRPPTQRTRK